MKNNFFILFILICIFSCKKEEERTGCLYKKKALVEAYVYPKSSTLECSFDYERNFVISISIGGDGYFRDPPRSSEMYWEYAYQYGDTAYNRCSWVIPVYCCTKLSLIDITCDKDIDENHKASVSLGDITEIIVTSYREYIQSGYVSYNTRIQKNLSEMSGDDYLLLSADGSMGLRIKDSKNLPKGEYKFFITFVTEENDIVTNDITIVN